MPSRSPERPAERLKEDMPAFTTTTETRTPSHLRRALKTLSARVIGPLLDLVLPLSCAVCGREGSLLCEECEPSLPKLEQPYCSVCAWPDRTGVCSRCSSSRLAVDGISAPYLFEGPVREMVHGFKYRGVRAAAPTVGGLLVRHMRVSSISADVVVPVPLHPSSERERGYNQSDLMARIVAADADLPFGRRLLRRRRKTAPQISMDRYEQRRRNIEGAFECVQDLDSRRILLIDDVVTTGSTMSACAEALKAAGARWVWGLALARQR